MFILLDYRQSKLHRNRAKFWRNIVHTLASANKRIHLDLFRMVPHMFWLQYFRRISIKRSHVLTQEFRRNCLGRKPYPLSLNEVQVFFFVRTEMLTSRYPKTRKAKTKISSSTWEQNSTVPSSKSTLQSIVKVCINPTGLVKYRDIILLKLNDK